MTPTDNPLVSLKTQEKKNYLARTYLSYKRAWKKGALKEKPTAQLAKAAFKEMCKEQWWANNLYSGSVEWLGEWATYRSSAMTVALKYRGNISNG